MRGNGPNESSNKLCKYVVTRVVPCEPAFQSVRDCDRGIKMSARNRAESQNESYERGARSERVREKSDCHIPARELLAHDSGADDGCEQKGGPDPFSA